MFICRLKKNDVNYAFKEIMKKVWIVNPYGALPTEGWLEYRSFKLARELISRGFEVTIWISKFEVLFFKQNKNDR